MKTRTSASHLTDEEVLKEFVKRFECDAAILIYRDSEIENGFGRWRNSEGRKWVNSVFKTLKQSQINENEFFEQKEGCTIQLTEY
ncbi:MULTISPECIES: hypothetical protein [Sphingobacterium]|uniref:hypothetical protein n=1 Tax=Sphingobacterium TaxID=28453 RepID=UPI0008A4AAE8|nr:MULTISPECIES: hypothetical protein [Sphingobacterium]OFV11842.1 hypothetical protein HMPREF3127_18435 [Sphingobacterium sp. HMSC13C05]HAF32592.1 hypothetical protein [Sphingobacterium sp.]HBX63298.1 hypothetical protein [Flavobacteriaceae bacterium]